MSKLRNLEGRVEEMIPITMFMCIATVLILRPISVRVGALLEAMTRERLQRQTPVASASDPQLARVTTLLEQLVRRQEQLEERLDFTERLLSGGRRQVKPPVTDSVGVFDDVRLSQEPVHGFHR